MENTKEIKSIVIKEVEGKMSFETKNFKPTEIIGLLCYYKKWMENEMLKAENSNEDNS